MFKYFEVNTKEYNIRCKIYFTDLKKAAKAVIFCTGFAGHKDNNAAFTFSEKVLAKNKDVAVVVFNWPAHGDDIRKKLALDDCMAYLSLVINEIKTNYGIEELYAYATSFGGYMLLKYISECSNPFRKIVLRCPAVDMHEVLTGAVIKNDEYDRIMKGKEVRVGFDRKVIITRDLLEQMKENDLRKRDFLDYADDILILHGTSDEVIPIESSRTFAEDNLIEFIPVEKADHRFQNPVHSNLANKYVREFFNLQ